MNTDNNYRILVNDDGFVIHLTNGVKNVLWKDILEINACKDDLITYDMINLDIVFADSVIKINEEIEGWSDFNEKISKVFPSIDKEWYIKIMLPAFDTNFTTLFKR